MNSNSEIYSKYIKYKNKYINLQNKINIQQTGGTALASGGGGGGGSDTSLATGISELIDAKTFLGLKESDEIKYIPIKTTYKTSEGKDIHLINIELNEDKDKPVADGPFDPFYEYEPYPVCDGFPITWVILYKNGTTRRVSDTLDFNNESTHKLYRASKVQSIRVSYEYQGSQGDSLTCSPKTKTCD